MYDNILPQCTVYLIGGHRWVPQVKVVPCKQLMATYYNKASFISTNHSHSLFRRKQNVQNISLKCVEDIGK